MKSYLGRLFYAGNVWFVSGLMTLYGETYTDVLPAEFNHQTRLVYSNYYSTSNYNMGANKAAEMLHLMGHFSHEI